jgi:glutathione synthase
MQAAQRAGHQPWVCTPADLETRGRMSLQEQHGESHRPWAHCQPIHLEPIRPIPGGWDLPEPWYRLGESEMLPLDQFRAVWMRKDPPVDEAYLYATHMLELAERQGVRIVNRPAALRAWNEKLGSLRFSHLMAPSLVSSQVARLAAFAADQGEVVLKPLGGKAGQGVVRVQAQAPGLRALLELVTDQQRMPVMAQAFLPGVRSGDKRILLVDGEPLGAVNRLPMAGEFRSNLALGGTPVPCVLNEAERQICARSPPPFAPKAVLRGHRCDRRAAQ